MQAAHIFDDFILCCPAALMSIAGAAHELIQHLWRIGLKLAAF
ncbi:MAG: hypothetical protein RR707_11535 [Comamonas sp.]